MIKLNSGKTIMEVFGVTLEEAQALAEKAGVGFEKVSIATAEKILAVEGITE